MFAISTIDKAVVGLFGFTIQLNITALLFDKITAVQVGKYTTIADPQIVGDFPEPVTSEVTLDVLQGYLNDPDAPRLAFNCGNGEVTIFCKNPSGVSDYEFDTEYRAGNYINHVIGATSTEAIWKCVADGVSSGALVAYEWLEAGVVESSGLAWEFVDYIPIPDTIDYDANNFVILFGLRNTQACTADNDKLDVPDRDTTLLINYVLATVWNIKKQHIPIKIQNIIDEEELRIKNE